MGAASKLPDPVALALSDVRRDGGTQSRAELSESTISEYAENIDDLPSVVVFFDGESYWLADGFHRWSAFCEAGRDEIPCIVHQGTRRDAVLWSVGANSTHGLRRTNADKRRAVEMVLRLLASEGKNESDRWIAEKCGVDGKTVAKVREESTAELPQSPRTGQDGKVRRVPERIDPEPVEEPDPSPLDFSEEPTEEPEPPKVSQWACPRCGAQYPLGVYPETAKLCGACANTAERPRPQPEPAPAPTDLDRLDTIIAQRCADADYQSLRQTQAAVARALPATRAQRMIDFVLDGGELAMLRLGVDWTVTADGLRHAYKSAAAKAHPDRGGSAESFVALGRARDIVAKMLAEARP